MASWAGSFLGAPKKQPAALRRARKSKPPSLRRGSTGPNREMWHGGKGPQAGLDRTAEFSWLGVLGMRVGIQLCASARRAVDRRDEIELRTASRQRVRFTRLHRTHHSTNNKVVRSSLLARPRTM